MSLFLSPPIVCPRGTNISHTQVRGDKHFSHTGGDKHFHIEGGGQTFLLWKGGQTFFVGGGGSYDDDDLDVSEASFLVSEANIFCERSEQALRRS